MSRPAAFIAVALTLAALPAKAQRLPCGDGAGLIAQLEKEWGEDPAVVALDAAGRMVRVLVNPQTGTWSMLITGPGGPTCLVYHGSNWEAIPPPPSFDGLTTRRGDPT